MRIPSRIALSLISILLCSVTTSEAQVPGLINYQGRVAVGSVNFDGTGQFKFALVNAAGTTTYWSNDGTSTAGGEPTAAVSLTVAKGRYSVLLGDTSLANMTAAIPASIFNNNDVRLRIWFNDGSHGSQRLLPDQRFGASGYALVAGTVADGSITAAKIANGAVGSSQIASGAIGSSQLASGITLAGTTAGTFSGPLTGNVTGNVSGTAASAASFTGALVGDVTGTQGATVVSTVGGNTASFIATGATLANAATDSNAASKIVKRDGIGDFVTRSITLAGSLKLASTTASTVGTIMQNGAPILHSFGGANFFAGDGCGNFSLTGTSNTAVGKDCFSSNTTGASNAAFGRSTLNANTTGNGNSAFGGAALLSNTTGSANCAFGSNALLNNLDGIYNSAVGYQALQDNTSGSSNCAMGLQALLRNTTGSENTGIGFQALSLNTTGGSNTAVGNGALYSSTTASNNVAVGNSALFSNTTGFYNAALGYVALMANTVGRYNAAVGAGALQLNATGDSNTAVGYQAANSGTAASGLTALGFQALKIATASDNTGVGYQALNAVTTGTGNIALGVQAGTALTTGNNNIAIGNSGVAGDTGTTRIGTLQTRAFIAGISGVTSSGGAAVFINPSGQLGTVTSSRRFKDNIQDMGEGSEAILALRPVSFRYKPEIDPKTIPQFGLIAEEVNEVNPDLVVRDDKGVIQTVRYEQVNAMLLNEFLKDHRRANARDVEITELKKRLAEMEARDKEREERLRRIEQLFLPAATNVSSSADVQ